MVPRAMSSTCSATLSTAFKIKGTTYSISSACSTSAHCIGNAAELIQFGKQDIMFAGGGEELDWTLSVLFDAMPAMSSRYNATPEKASRAYDKDRDGFVIAGDITELNAIREVFGDSLPAISSTKSLTGHSQGAAGVHEAIYSLLMMRDSFLAASANIENLDPGAEGFPILRQRKDNVTLNRVMSNSFGFGGTNASLLFQRYDA